MDTGLAPNRKKRPIKCFDSYMSLLFCTENQQTQTLWCLDVEPTLTVTLPAIISRSHQSQHLFCYCNLPPEGDHNPLVLSICLFSPWHRVNLSSSPGHQTPNSLDWSVCFLSSQDEALHRLECGAAGAAGTGVFGPEAAHSRRRTFPDADSRQVAFSWLLRHPGWSWDQWLPV